MSHDSFKAELMFAPFSTLGTGVVMLLTVSISYIRMHHGVELERA